MEDKSKKIQKPISIVKEEFIQNLIKLTNDTNLPYFIMEYILKDFLNEIHVVSQQQFETDKLEYQKQLESK